jgi:TorA maturation chaperone TorD
MHVTPKSHADGAPAEARGRGYVLLADLLSRGPTGELVGPARASDVLAAALDETGDLDEAAADHQHVFGFVVPPFEGAFLDPRGQVGDRRSVAVQERYAAFGYQSHAGADGPEHLATELRALGVLCGAEADAATDGRSEIVAHLRQLQRGWLDDHVLRWFPVLASAAHRSGRRWPSALLDQIADLLALHRETLPPPAGEAAPLTGEPLDLQDADTDLRSIAHFLSTPARSGIFLGKDDLAVVGRALELPRGFGPRHLLTQNLLRSAIRFEKLAEATEALGAIVDDWSDETARSPFAHHLAPWAARAAATREALRAIGEAGARFEGEDRDG